MAEHIDLRAQLAIGRSPFDVGRVPEISEWICGMPRRIPQLVELLWDDEPGVASRAADVLERIMRRPSGALGRAVAGYKDALIGLLSEAQPPKVRWNLALTIPRLELTIPECRRVACVLRTFLDDRSSIVKTAALHGSRVEPAGSGVPAGGRRPAAHGGSLRHTGHARPLPHPPQKARKPTGSAAGTHWFAHVWVRERRRSAEPRKAWSLHRYNRRRNSPMRPPPEGR